MKKKNNLRKMKPSYERLQNLDPSLSPKQRAREIEEIVTQRREEFRKEVEEQREKTLAGIDGLDREAFDRAMAKYSQKVCML